MSQRTGKSIKNASISSLVQVITLALNFVVRTALVYGLGSYYLGLNSVMTSLIAVFNLAELGFTNAVVYSLYKPIAEGDTEAVQAYLCLYKKIYRFVGVLIIAISLAVLPFLPSLINAEPTIEVYVIYFLQVASAVASYLLFTYRGALLQADQQKYLISYSDCAYYIISSVGQTICFAIFGNYIAGLAVLVLSQLVRSCMLYRFSVEYHPNISFSSKAKLDKSKTRELFKNVYAMAIGKFSDTASRNVPNIAISSLIGLAESGIYSNYQMLMQAVINIMAQLFGSITAGVGNLHVEASVKSQIAVYERLNFIAFFVYTVCSTCVFVGSTPFINAWLGEGYTLDILNSAGVAANIMVIGLLHGTVVFKDGCGVFYQGRFRPLVSCVVTVVLSFCLVPFLGLPGAVWAPVISRLTTACWYDPWLLYKYVFHSKPYKFYAEMIVFAGVASICMAMTYGVFQLLPGNGWLLFAESIIVGIAIPCFVISIAFFKYEPFRYVVSLSKRICTFSRLRR